MAQNKHCTSASFGGRPLSIVQRCGWAEIRAARDGAVND